MPVPVQTRMPRLNMAEAWPTPARSPVSLVLSLPSPVVLFPSLLSPSRRTELQLPCPHRLRRVRHQLLGEVPLHTADHVVVRRVLALADDAEGVVLEHGRAADAAEQALLHAAVEAEDGDLGRRLCGRVISAGC
jgi:hypothetical protein